MMSLPDNRTSPTRTPPASEAEDRPSMTAAQVAHELANLLDASLRNVGLVLTDLRRGERPVRGGAEDDPIERLETVSQGLRQMAELLQPWVRRRPGAAAPGQAQRLLGVAVEQAVNLMRPVLEAHAIVVATHVSAAAGAQPAGAIDPLLINALRNSVEAMPAESAPGGGRIEIRAEVAAGEVVVRVRDNGGGLDRAVLDGRGGFVFGRTTKPGGHGLGLTVCREIARSLHGTLELRDVPPRGAELVLRYPAAGADA